MKYLILIAVLFPATAFAVDCVGGVDNCKNIETPLLPEGPIVTPPGNEFVNPQWCGPKYDVFIPTTHPYFDSKGDQYWKDHYKACEEHNRQLKCRYEWWLWGDCE